MTDEQASSIVGAAHSLGGKLISNLPAQFLVLVLMNTIFIVGLLWFVNQQDQIRERLLGPIVTSCVQQVPGEVLKQLLERKP